MNASRTHQEAAHATNAGEGRQPYQPGAAIACRACNRLVYRTQTFVWDLDTDIRQAKTGQYSTDQRVKHMRAGDARTIPRPLTRAYKNDPCPSPPARSVGGTWRNFSPLF